MCPVRGQLKRQFVIIVDNYVRKWYLPLWENQGGVRFLLPGLVAVITALHIKMSSWPQTQTEAWPPHYNLQAWLPMSGGNGPKWIFNPKLTMPHIAYSVQVKSFLHHPIIPGQVGSVTWISGKINALSPQYCIGVTPQQCVSFFLLMPRTPLWCGSEMTERHGLFSPCSGNSIAGLSGLFVFS